MADYRAYFVGDAGHFIGFEPMICRDDAEAIKNARRLIGGYDIELWTGERHVVTLKAKKP